VRRFIGRLTSLEWLILFIWILGFAVYAMQPLSDPDTPWHIATGQYILQHHFVPTHDVFSWSSKGQPWITQEWLFEVVLAWLVNHLQFIGAWLLYAGIHGATVVALYRLGVIVTKDNRVIAAVLAGAGTFPAIDFWTLRPQIFSYFMFAVFLLILAKVRQGNFAVLWFVPLLIFVWANTHGSSSIGVVACLLEVAVSFIPSFGRFSQTRLPNGARWRLVVAPLAGMALGLLNPNGYKAYTYALLGTKQLMVNNIMEWHSPDFHTFDFKYGVLPYLIVVFIIILASKRRLPMREILFFGGSFAVTLVYQRFLPYMAIAAVPLLASVLSQWLVTLNYLRRWMQFVNVLLVAAVIGIFLGQTPQVRGNLNSHFSATAYPVAAVNYLKQHPVHRLLNSYAWGGYLIYEGIPTFVDGRTDVFMKNGVFSDYLALQNIWWNCPDLISEYHFDAVLFPPGSQIITYLTQDANWRVVYVDPNAEILEPAKSSKSQ